MLRRDGDSRPNRPVVESRSLAARQPCRATRPTAPRLRRKLIAFAEAEARRLRFAELRLYTHEAMSQNVAVYARRGFEETGCGHEASYDRVFTGKRLNNFP